MQILAFGRPAHPRWAILRGMDDALDLDTVRLLSVWMSARRDLGAHLDLLTAYGPSATAQVERNLLLVDDLHTRDHAGWVAYREHVLSRSAGSLGETHGGE